MTAEQPLVRPFRALRPAPGRAAEVIAPPYDVLSSAEARARAAGRPWSFLHVSKAEIDLPETTDTHADEVYARAAANLRALCDAGVLVRDARPCYYVYRLAMGPHVQTGLAVSASVAAYESNRIRRHEHTLPAKVRDRARQIEAVGAQTGPVLLACPDSPALDEIVRSVTLAEAAADVTADDGIRHTLWVVADEGLIDRISRTVERLPALYIADGHHRSAAAAAVAATRGGPGAHQSFLAVMFPYRQMRILDYNRVVRDLNGRDAAAFVRALEHCCTVRAADAAVAPARPERFGMYLDGHWYCLDVHPDRVPAADPVARLDVSLLTDLVLEPVLGIGDLRRDPRIEFVGGSRGLAELERRVDSGDMAVAFALHPTGMADLMAVADAGEVMPPKSTWFEPKLADGLLSHVLD
ncbi:MAG: DUF1015 domain-containing protein [Gammaproteobacteria bacterium]|nr:DUF1015 domain-containing protein [Gammaproteobacteria bacterium]